MPDPSTLSASEAAAQIAAGTLSASALAEAMLARIAKREKVLQAFAWLKPAQIRKQAADVDAALKAGRKLPLAGLFLGVKDVLDTCDHPSQYGSPIWAGHKPRNDAASVALARRAGAVISKTVTTEFATRHPGPTTNPHNPAHSPGGSSSGSAAGVGAGLLHLAYGTQTGGSIVRPAAYCGIVGFKPSWGTFHRAGMKVMSESLDTIGLMAGSLADIAFAMTALTGVDHALPQPGKAPRLALVMGPSAKLAAPETLELMDKVAYAARAKGATVTPLELGAPFATAYELHPHVMNMESAEAMGWELDHAREGLSAVLRERLDWAMGEPRAKLAEGRAAFQAAQDGFAAAISGYDAVLTPSAPGEAPEGLASTGDAAFNSLWTLLHVPAVTIPAGKGPKGLPLGAQIVTPRGQDAAALMWAEWLRGALHG
ncbi:amidase [Roseococcus sp. SYP-B2431]|uniref:amidase n=1 Tax=Roseococcus sp. SYP-B2431 TaxID=2496640 RepID=UPI00103ECBE3|nr:amidase [Roseococcus sp. SYP-B2431]TCH99846.1 amidase [Roseococcus sp. SYP-B2431]